ncbi:uncharacterized protein BDV17DRAFT_265719 [Aspergillus undulatus]|uniref:uncharacterized protein n=1 Tax=Aspergillus undulatus TaxID=1810928 RepID=UPI003CCD1FC6
MLDLKDRMIVEYKERRDKTHETVDDVEANVEGQPCPECQGNITKWCFVQNCFDWCLTHSAISTASHGEATSRLLSQSKDSSGNTVVKESTMVVRKCGSPDAGADCDIICCEYSYDEWVEEERTEWMAQQMCRGSP